MPKLFGAVLNSRLGAAAGASAFCEGCGVSIIGADITGGRGGSKSWNRFGSLVFRLGRPDFLYSWGGVDSFSGSWA